MLFYDMEVFKYDWLGVFIDMETERTTAIHNDRKTLTDYFNEHSSSIWVGYNNKHYDQYIVKGIMLDLNPKDINDSIIIHHMDGWQISPEFNKIPMINYDVKQNLPGYIRNFGLKTIEGFMGSDIRETEVRFDVDRPLTEEELQQTIYYCTHDVEGTIKVFMANGDTFYAMKQIVEAFPKQVTLADIGDTEARITAKVLGCRKTDRMDEFDFEFLPCLRLKKYKFVQDWFAERRAEAQRLHLGNASEKEKKEWYKQQNLSCEICGITFQFGFGGVHGAPDHPIRLTRADGAGYHVDVNNYYPSMLNAYGLVTRSATNDNYMKVYNTRKAMKMKQLAAKTRQEAKAWKKKQLPYKKMLNALSGAMKDRTNPAYDPRNNNTMCINGQLMLLDLVEHLEVIPGFRPINVNTDGLVVWVPDTDEAFYQMDDICYEWEHRCSTDKCEIGLALDCLDSITQKDVNNYLWVDAEGGIERIGSYVKELSQIDNDLPIINKAVVDCLSKGVPVEETINGCNDLGMFQKMAKLTKAYDHVEKEFGEYKVRSHFYNGRDGIHAKGQLKSRDYIYQKENRILHEQNFRVFASKDMREGRLIKCKALDNGKFKRDKFGNTPDHCFIWNESTEGVKCPENLDKEWYISLAKQRIEDYGIKDERNNYQEDAVC